MKQKQLGKGGQMLNKLIEQIAHRLNREPIRKIEDIKLEIQCTEDVITGLIFEMNKREYAYFRRGSCKGCLFSAKDEKLLQEGKCYCIFNPRPEIVALKHKCGRIVKR